MLLEILRTSLKIEDSGVREAAVRILEGAISHCATYASKEHSGSLLQILLVNLFSIFLLTVSCLISVCPKILFTRFVLIVFSNILRFSRA